MTFFVLVLHHRLSLALLISLISSFVTCFVVSPASEIDFISPFQAKNRPSSFLASSAINLAEYLDPCFSDDASLLCSTQIAEIFYPEERTATTTTPLSESKPLRQQLFSSPLISLLYERILPPLWNAGLRVGGPQEEYNLASSFLKGDGSGVALDLSCGTGFVGRRMASSHKFKHVFMLDYSKQMLGECQSTILRQGEQDLSLSLIRGDAGRLPFRNASIDAVHWGAAMHCVPSAEQALAEIFRILKPGGKLYATTFLRPFPDVVFRFFTVKEIQDMAQTAGFSGNVEKKGVYGILRAIKP